MKEKIINSLKQARDEGLVSKNKIAILSEDLANWVKEANKFPSVDQFLDLVLKVSSREQWSTLTYNRLRSLLTGEPEPKPKDPLDFLNEVDLTEKAQVEGTTVVDLSLENSNQSELKNPKSRNRKA